MAPFFWGGKLKNRKLKIILDIIKKINYSIWDYELNSN